jgi:peptidoglycan hydrolase-like protein with peptidoglycan-binding domain
MGIHADEKVFIDLGFYRCFARDPSLVESQVCQGVDFLETTYGKGWKSPAGKLSRNRGAVQAGLPPCDPQTSFLYKDTHPNPDGTSTSYSICFKSYPDDPAACADLVRNVMGTASKPKKNVLDACARGDLWGVSAGMRANRYYEGFGKTQAERIENHRRALAGAIKRRCDELGEPFPSGKPTTMGEVKKLFGSIFDAPKKPKIERGSRSEAVKDWQRFIGGLVVDGIFGPLTELETIEWQGKHKNVVTGKPLKVDGVVGTETWAAAEVEARALPEAA